MWVCLRTSRSRPLSRTVLVLDDHVDGHGELFLLRVLWVCACCLCVCVCSCVCVCVCVRGVFSWFCYLYLGVFVRA